MKHNTLKKILSLLLVICMMTSFAGYAPGEENHTEPSTIETTGPIENTTAPTDGTTAPTDITDATTSPTEETQAPTEPTEVETEPPATEVPNTDPTFATEVPTESPVETFVDVVETVYDPILLGAKSELATTEDLHVGQDLLDTLIANKEACVGMAANMIGVHKRIIVFDDDGIYMTIFNPEIIKMSGPYDTEEGCLSLLGGPRPCKRYQAIKVRWQNEQFQTRIKTFTGWSAQIIQHEIDHCNGVLI